MGVGWVVGVGLGDAVTDGGGVAVGQLDGFGVIVGLHFRLVVGVGFSVGMQFGVISCHEA